MAYPTPQYTRITTKEWGMQAINDNKAKMVSERMPYGISVIPITSITWFFAHSVHLLGAGRRACLGEGEGKFYIHRLQVGT